MKLNVTNRLNISRIFPKKGTILRQLMVKDMIEKIKFTPEEIKKLDFKQDPKTGAVTYNYAQNNLIVLDVQFTKEEMAILREQMGLLDTESNVTQDMLDICLLIKNEK